MLHTFIAACNVYELWSTLSIWLRGGALNLTLLLGWCIFRPLSCKFWAHCPQVLFFAHTSSLPSLLLPVSEEFPRVLLPAVVEKRIKEQFILLRGNKFQYHSQYWTGLNLMIYWKAPPNSLPLHLLLHKDLQIHDSPL